MLQISKKLQKLVSVDWFPCCQVVTVILKFKKKNTNRHQYISCEYFGSVLEAVVAESVVVIKKLLQNQPEAHCDIIRHMARLMDSIAVPQARASILWLLGEYSQLVSTIAPDVLRKVAKSFVTEVKNAILY